MKKRIIMLAVITVCLMLLFAFGVNAQDAYVERVPSNLVDKGESLEYFIVLDGEEYFNASDSTLSTINSDNVKSALDKLVLKGEYTDAVTALGTKYMIKFVFPASVNGTAITHIYLNNAGFKSNTYFANYCGAIVYAPTHTSTGDANQYSGKIRSIDFGENSQITKIPTCYMNCASNLRELKNFPKYLTSIEQSAFAYCAKLDGVLYINAVTVHKKAFDCGIVNVDGIILGKDTVNLETEAFGTTNGSTNVKFIEFQGDVTKMNIVESANNQGAFYFSSGSQRKPYSGLICLVLSHPNNQALITEGITTFQDILPNVYFNADSMNGGNLVKKGHNNQYTVSYESFLEKGTKYGVCTDCNHFSDVVEAPALFTCLGYSAALSGDMMSVNYRVNAEAIAEYEKITGEKISYGVFAVTKKNIEKNDIFDAEGNALEGVIAADITGTGFNLFTLKITGFTEAQKELPFAMGAFVGAEKDGATEYSYLQIAAPAEGEKYYFATYNEVVALTPSDDEESAQ